MHDGKLGRAFLAGVGATFALTLLGLLAVLVGVPGIDYARLWIGLFGVEVLPGGGVWWLGLLIHFVTGTVVLPFAYHYAYDWFSDEPWVRGLMFGVGLWILAESIALPLAGEGFFGADSRYPLLLTLNLFFAHLLYGYLLGRFAGNQSRVVEEPGRDDARSGRRGARQGTSQHAA